MDLLENTSQSPSRDKAPHLHEVSVVIPVYRGEKTLRGVVEEILEFSEVCQTRAGFSYRVSEIVLVNDDAIDDSQAVMEELAAAHRRIRIVYLSRNFGQHAATLAGIASTVSEWVVTLDEDGQQDPADIAALLEMALVTRAQLVYADPTEGLPHTFVRNQASKATKRFFSFVVGTRGFGRFNSFRLVQGEIARSLVACGNSVYLDGALSWVARSPAYCPVKFRSDDRTSGYSYFKLLDHFTRLVFTSRTTPLRLVSCLGAFAVLFSLGMGFYAFCLKIAGDVPVPGWTSLVILLSFFFGITLFSIGIVAEYLGLILTLSMGRPLYLIVSTPPAKAST